MKTPRIRRLAVILALMFSRPAQPRPLDEIFATDRGRFVARIRVTVPTSECPLPDCATCRSDARPLDVVAEEQRALDVEYASSWLVEHYPECWYFEDGAKLRAFAAGIVALRARVRREGRVAP